MEVLHHYNDHHNKNSALQVVPYILEILPKRPESVIDVGCGVAQWLKVFKENGIKEVLGIDGEHVPSNKKMIDSDSEFKIYDLRNIQSLNLGRKYDLALNLEVAEHLPEQNADDLVDFLTSYSDVIVFSAAIKGQSGENHINEQDPSYWKEKFERRGFVMLDAFRKKLWNNNEINWWYRQNLVLLVRKEQKERFPFEEYENFYIHPELFKLQPLILQTPAHGILFRLKSILKID